MTIQRQSQIIHHKASRHYHNLFTTLESQVQATIRVLLCGVSEAKQSTGPVLNFSS